MIFLYGGSELLPQERWDLWMPGKLLAVRQHLPHGDQNTRALRGALSVLLARVPKLILYL